MKEADCEVRRQSRTLSTFIQLGCEDQYEFDSPMSLRICGVKWMLNAHIPLIECSAHLLSSSMEATKPHHSAEWLAFLSLQTSRPKGHSKKRGCPFDPWLEAEGPYMSLACIFSPFRGDKGPPLAAFRFSPLPGASVAFGFGRCATPPPAPRASRRMGFRRRTS